MSQEFGVFISTFTTMLVIVDPFGNLPIFMSLTSHLPQKQRRRVAWEANLLAFIILLVFGFFGFHLFSLLGITPAALQLSGGLLLIIVALQLLTGEEAEPQQGSGAFNIAAVPLGTPLLAGPGGIVALMVQMDATRYAVIPALVVLLGVLLVMVVSWLTMHFASQIMLVLGQSGVAVLTRLSGLLLAAIAMQLMISGVLSVVNDVISHH